MGGRPSLPMDWLAPAKVKLPLPVSITLTDLSTSTEALVHLSWESYSLPSNFLEFRVYRAEAPFNYVSAITPIATTSGFAFDDYSAEKRKTYYYAVTAVTSDGRELIAVTSAPLTSGDNDGLDDVWEMRFFGGLSAFPEEDSDMDGLSNLREMQEYTDPTRSDSDGDFAPDGIELDLGMNPLAHDVVPLTLAAANAEVEVGAMLTMQTKGGCGGTVTIEAVGGSGVYGWALSDDTLASMEGFGTSRTFSSQSASGEFHVEVWDIVRSDLAPLTATITIGNVPGDVNGDSLVMLDDAIVVLKVLAGINESNTIFIHADVNGNGTIGTEELIYILQKVADFQ